MVDSIQNKPASGGPPPGPPIGAPRQPTPRLILLLQFFVIPLAIVLIAVGIYLGFTWMSGQSRSAADILKEITDSGGKRRGELSLQFLQVVMKDKLGWPQDRAGWETRNRPLANETLEVLRRIPKVQEEELARCSLIEALGIFNNEKAVPEILESAKDPMHSVRVSSVEALAMMNHESLVPTMLELLRHEDYSYRKRAAYALGKYKGNTPAAEALRTALSDPREEVSWNAALALARLGDPAGTPVLLKMLDRKYVTEVVQRSTREALQQGIKLDHEAAYVTMLIDEVIRGAVRAAEYLNTADPEFLKHLDAVGRNDPNPNIRHEAQKISAKLRK